MVLVFIGLLVGVVLIIALNERMSDTTRENLLDHLRQHPNEGNQFRERLNRIQTRVNSWDQRKQHLFIFDCLSFIVVVLMIIEIISMLTYGLNKHLFLIHVALNLNLIVQNLCMEIKHYNWFILM